MRWEYGQVEYAEANSDVVRSVFEAPISAAWLSQMPTPPSATLVATEQALLAVLDVLGRQGWEVVSIPDDDRAVPGSGWLFTQFGRLFPHQEIASIRTRTFYVKRPIS